MAIGIWITTISTVAVFWAFHIRHSPVRKANASMMLLFLLIFMSQFTLSQAQLTAHIQPMVKNNSLPTTCPIFIINEMITSAMTFLIIHMSKHNSANPNNDHVRYAGRLIDWVLKANYDFVNQFPSHPNNICTNLHCFKNDASFAHVVSYTFVHEH